MPTEKKPRRPKNIEPVAPPADTYAAPLTPDMPVTFTHTVGGLSVEVPPIVREESAEKWGYVPPSDDVVVPVGGVYPAMPLAAEDVTPEGAFTHTVEWSAPRELSITLPNDGTTYKVYLPGVDAPVFVWPPPESARPETCEEYATRILADDPRTALALYRRIARGHGLAEWRTLGAGAQLVDLGTGDMLALVAPEGRRFVASYVESGTNLAGPTADTLDACKDAVANRMRARGVGVL